MVTEEWRPIPGFDGYYEASNLGRIRSLDRTVIGRNGRSRSLKGKVLRPAVKPSGYMFVLLSRDGMPTNRHVHYLVAQAFIGPRPDGLDVCHNNGNKADNAVPNLRYDTRSANIKDAVTHGAHGQTKKKACPQGHPYDQIISRARRCSICRRAQRSVK